VIPTFPALGPPVLFLFSESICAPVSHPLSVPFISVLGLAMLIAVAPGQPNQSVDRSCTGNSSPLVPWRSDARGLSWDLTLERFGYLSEPLALGASF